MRHVAYATRAAFLVALIFLCFARPAVADLVGFWSFDDETATDLSGNGNDGVINGLQFSDDVPNASGKSLDVFGGGTVRIPHSDSLGMADTLSIAFWMKANNDDQGSNWNGTMGKIGTPRESSGWETQRWDVQSRIDIRIDTSGGSNSVRGNLTGTFDDEWVHVAWTVDTGQWESFLNGELVESGTYPHGDGFANENDLFLGNRANCCAYTGLLDEVGIWNHVLTLEEIEALAAGNSPVAPRGVLQPGDADQDLDFDQLDLVRVQIAAKFLTGSAATWGEGDWNGAPGGSPGNPPAGNGRFDQLDIVAALTANKYLTGPYAAINRGGTQGDGQASIIYNPSTGELGVDAPAGTNLTSINIDSASAVFTGTPAQNLGGSFDNDSDGNIFKATFGSSFGSLSFGNVARTGLSEDFVANDLTVVGSLAGGGGLGNVDLIYVPEPAAIVLLVVGLAVVLVRAGRTRR
jgi:hypothetical protein